MRDDAARAEVAIKKWMDDPDWEATGSWGSKSEENLLRYVAEAIADAAAQAAQWERHTWNVTKPVDAPPRCVGCGGPHPFDTSVPSEAWNRVIRSQGLPDYLCTTCIVRAFVLAGEGFDAALWGDEFNGIEISVAIRARHPAAGRGEG